MSTNAKYRFDFSELAIVGTETNTTVWIMPSPTADLTNHTSAYSINLNQGQTYEIANNSVIGDDVTGTFVTSDKPIAVFAGDNVAFVPDDNTKSGNPLIQEQIPIEQWGTNVVAISFAGRLYGDTYRILTAESNAITILNTNGILFVTNLVAGGFCETNLDGPVEFESTKPIQVAQFANGTDYDYQEGDPCEILLSPTTHYLMSYNVFCLPNDGVAGNFDESYLNLIVPQSATNATYVDDSLIVATNFVPILNTGYYGAQVPVMAGTHTINSMQPIEVQVYGWGIDNAYGYFGGIAK